jgi:hypothetical protein
MRAEVNHGTPYEIDMTRFIEGQNIENQSKNICTGGI